MQESRFDSLTILVVEDEPLLRRQITAELEKLGATVSAAESLQKAKKFVSATTFDFAFLDVHLPDGLGTDLLNEGHFAVSTPTVVMTAYGAVAGAIESMRRGAVDYLVKPFDMGVLPLVIERACQIRQAARADEHRRRTVSGQAILFDSTLAGLEQQLEKILAADRRVREHQPPILIQGETGAGKTTIARWLHHHGPRCEQELIEVNCSTLSESLAESELFGHEQGAFTDARATRIGLFEAANGGTLFLDELPSLSPLLQAKVLTVIEDHKIRRVGSNKQIGVDVRIIAASNQDLKKLVAEGKFREDLYHRLDLYRIAIPPLRERKEGVLPVAEFLMAQICHRHRLGTKKISAIGQKRLLAYPWPGNLRELAHELERSIVFEEKEFLDFEHLPMSVPDAFTGSTSHWFNEKFEFPAEGFQLEEAIGELIQRALKKSGNNVSAAARMLGVSRDYIRYRLKNEGSAKEVEE